MTLPNIISIMRLCLAPIVVWLMVIQRNEAAFFVFVLAGCTDLMDGALARLMNSGSDLGKYLDPIADKALLMSVFITQGFQHALPSWLVILVIFRDIMILGGALLVLVTGQPFKIRPHFISKTNTLLQIFLITITLWPYGHVNGLVPMLTDILIYSVALTSLISGALYIILWLRDVPECTEKDIDD